MTICTNTFNDLYKYIWQFGQINLAILTNTITSIGVNSGQQPNRWLLTCTALAHFHPAHRLLQDTDKKQQGYQNEKTQKSPKKCKWLTPLYSTCPLFWLFVTESQNLNKFAYISDWAQCLWLIFVSALLSNVSFNRTSTHWELMTQHTSSEHIYLRTHNHENTYPWENISLANPAEDHYTTLFPIYENTSLYVQYATVLSFYSIHLRHVACVGI